jgi:hypothetical protein
MPKYIRFEDVRLRLVGKVRFTADPGCENEMSEELAIRLINEGEGQVELDLSLRYAAPFQGINGEPFRLLPSTAKEIIRTLCEIQGVMKILDIDFGRGTVVNASNYYDRLEKRYDSLKKSLLDRRDGYGSGWLLPPLDGLRLSYQNKADDGYVGMVLVAGDQGHSGSYPADRINDPSRTFWGAYDDDADEREYGR